jgi:hypothetical protein
MQRFLQFRLRSYRLPTAVGRFAAGQHAARANSYHHVVVNKEWCQAELRSEVF